MWTGPMGVAVSPVRVLTSLTASPDSGLVRMLPGGTDLFRGMNGQPCVAVRPLHAQLRLIVRRAGLAGRLQRDKQRRGRAQRDDPAGGRLQAGVVALGELACERERGGVAVQVVQEGLARQEQLDRSEVAEGFQARVAVADHVGRGGGVAAVLGGQGEPGHVGVLDLVEGGEALLAAGVGGAQLDHEPVAVPDQASGPWQVGLLDPGDVPHGGDDLVADGRLHGQLVQGALGEFDHQLGVRLSRVLQPGEFEVGQRARCSCSR